jgi:hypothetical protein
MNFTLFYRKQIIFHDIKCKMKGFSIAVRTSPFKNKKASI